MHADAQTNQDVGTPGEGAAPTATTFVIMELSAQRFGVDVAHVREILDNQKITPMPNAAPDCIGVVDTRGQSIPVTDLARRFSMAALEESADTRIIVFEIGGEEGAGAIAIRADRVLSVLAVEPDEIEPAPVSAFAELHRTGVSGLIRRDGALVTLLRIEHLLGPGDAATRGGRA